MTTSLNLADLRLRSRVGDDFLRRPVDQAPAEAVGIGTVAALIRAALGGEHRGIAIAAAEVVRTTRAWQSLKKPSAKAIGRCVAQALVSAGQVTHPWFTMRDAARLCIEEGLERRVVEVVALIDEDDPFSARSGQPLTP